MSIPYATMSMVRTRLLFGIPIRSIGYIIDRLDVLMHSIVNAMLLFVECLHKV
jgi:hypothetical protein